MRDVFARLERLASPYYLTGSEALARYGQPRQSMDIDIVVAMPVAAFPQLARAFEADFLVNDPIDFGGRSMASLVAVSALGKVDLIIGRDDAWGRLAMERRQRWEHPEHGPLWVASLEDLILAKLEWSQGVSELQLRDVRNLIATNASSIDEQYLETWARAIGVTGLLEAVRDAT